MTIFLIFLAIVIAIIVLPPIYFNIKKQKEKEIFPDGYTHKDLDNVLFTLHSMRKFVHESWILELSGKYAHETYNSIPDNLEWKAFVITIWQIENEIITDKKLKNIFLCDQFMLSKYKNDKKCIATLTLYGGELNLAKSMDEIHDFESIEAKPKYKRVFNVIYDIFFLNEYDFLKNTEDRLKRIGCGQTTDDYNIEFTLPVKSIKEYYYSVLETPMLLKEKAEQQYKLKL